MNIESTVDVIVEQLRLHVVSVEDALRWMKVHGSSVCLNYGEDNDLWECSWITGGTRYTGFGNQLRDAIRQSLNKSFATVKSHG